MWIHANYTLEVEAAFHTEVFQNCFLCLAFFLKKNYYFIFLKAALKQEGPRQFSFLVFKPQEVT